MGKLVTTVYLSAVPYAHTITITQVLFTIYLSDRDTCNIKVHNKCRYQNTPVL